VIGVLSCRARHLDVTGGTGHLVAAATKLGAQSKGADFAQRMIDVARANYPNRIFDVADAAKLPHESNTFDVVTCAFGLPHMAAPQAACDEAFRVLKSGGVFAFSLWPGAEEGGVLFALVESAIRAHGASASAMPKEWTAFRFAHQNDCSAIVGRSGFTPPVFRILRITSHCDSAEAIVEIVDKVSVRTALIIQA
jgi:ubiquinone/menaquinone biosynthesis C-methylase UbiE